MYVTVFRNGNFRHEQRLPPDDRPYVINWRGAVWLSEHFEIFGFSYKPFPWFLEPRLEELAKDFRDVDRIPMEIRAIVDEAAFRTATLSYREENPYETINGWFERGVMTCYPAAFEIGPCNLEDYSLCTVTVDVRGALHLGEGKVVAVGPRSGGTHPAFCFHELSNGRFAGIKIQSFLDSNGDRKYYSEVVHPNLNGSARFCGETYRKARDVATAQLDNFDRRDKLIE